MQPSLSTNAHHQEGRIYRLSSLVVAAVPGRDQVDVVHPLHYSPRPIEVTWYTAFDVVISRDVERSINVVIVGETSVESGRSRLSTSSDLELTLALLLLLLRRLVVVFLERCRHVCWVMLVHT